MALEGSFVVLVHTRAQTHQSILEEFEETSVAVLSHVVDIDSQDLIY